MRDGLANSSFVTPFSRSSGEMRAKPDGAVHRHERTDGDETAMEVTYADSYGNTSSESQRQRRQRAFRVWRVRGRQISWSSIFPKQRAFCLRGFCCTCLRRLLADIVAFPRYVFLGIERCWDAARDVSHGLGLVNFGEEIAIVREHIVDKLIERCGGGCVLPPEDVPEPFFRGQMVEVGGLGPAAGHKACYETVLEDGRLRLLFDWMGRFVPIDVDQRDVFSVEAKPSDKKRRKRRGRRGRKRN